MAAAGVKKKAVAAIRLVIPAAAAKPSPPVGPALGQAGLNIMGFCKEFNARTAAYKEGVPLRVSMTVFSDKTYEWQLKMPHTSWFVKKAVGLQRAADNPGHEVAGVISVKHLYEIAKVKQQDTPHLPLETVTKNIMHSCSSMGVNVVARPEDA